MTAAPSKDLIPQPHGGAIRGWPKGVSGNPAGNQTAGAVISLNYNCIAGLTIAEYRAIASDDSASGARRVAAMQWLETLGADMADIEPFLRGNRSLRDLRAAGVNTRMVKKASIRRTESEEGTTEHITVELRHGGEALDRIADRTQGKPTQFVQVQRIDPSPAELEARLAMLYEQCPELMDAGKLPVIDHDTQRPVGE